MNNAIELPESSEISVSQLMSTLDNTVITGAYKPFWLWAIVSLIIESSRNSNSSNIYKISTKSIAIRMLTFGWIYIHDYSFDMKKDKLFEIVKDVEYKKPTEKNLRLAIIQDIITEYIEEYPNAKKEILKYVPYRFLSPFYCTYLTGMQDGLKNKKIAELSQSIRSIYCINNDESISIAPQWYDYFLENNKVIIKWIQEIIASSLIENSIFNVKEIKESPNIDRKELEAKSLKIDSLRLDAVLMPVKYHSLIVRLKSIYGQALTLKDLLCIEPAEFSLKKGVGTTYIKRLGQLKEYLNKNHSIEYAQNEIKNEICSEIIRMDSAFFRKIKECFPHIESFNDINSISPDEFASFPGVGRSKVQHLIKLQSELAPNEQITSENDIILTQLESYRFLYLHLSSSEEKLLKKLENSEFYSGEITPADIYKIQENEFASWVGVGKTSCTVLTTLKDRIHESLINHVSVSILVHDQFGESSSIKELESLLIEDIEKFHSKLSGNNEVIWSSRLGYNTESLTLREIGKNLNITFERVRQIERKLNKRFIECIRVKSEIIWNNIQNKTRVELFNEFESLRVLFSADNDLLRVLAIISNQESKEFIAKYNPTINNHVLDEFLIRKPFPAKRYDIFSFLHEEVGGTEQEIDIYFSTLINSNIIRAQGDIVIPIGLGKELAIAHVLSGYPGGLDWSEISHKVNESGICHTNLSMDRPDPNLTFSSYFYQSGQGKYSHIRFFPIKKAGIKLILEDVKSALLQSPYKSLHLMTEYYSTLRSPQYDYYVIRHAVRNFGETCGLFFNGKSQSDTVSLNPSLILVSQKEAIKRLFIKNGLPITVQEVTKLIKSQSESHARLYLDELMISGDIVNIEANKYQLRGNAFKGIDAPKILNSIYKMLNEDQRIHHISVITHHMNKLYNYEYSNRFWRSFIVSYSNDMGWFIKSMLVSLNEIHINGLLELVRANRGKSRDDIIAIVQQKVCISSEGVMRAINNDELKLSEIWENRGTEGLASDIMEELFTL